MNILLLGSNGRLGSCFKNFFKKKNIKFNEINKKSFFAKQKNFENFLKNKIKKKVDLIINCIALTNVDLCNKDHKLAYKVNSEILDNIVKSLINLKIKPTLVHFSTDQIYNSSKLKKSGESEINPCNFYGISKYIGELNVSKIRKHIIIRTSFFGKSYNKKKNYIFRLFNKKFKKKTLKYSKQSFF